MPFQFCETLLHLQNAPRLEAQLTVGISEVFCLIYPDSDLLLEILTILFLYEDRGLNAEVESGEATAFPFNSVQFS